MNWIVGIFLFLSLQAVAERTPGGGVYIDPAQFPAVVKINLEDGSYCSAAVVGPNTLLTAAHCFKNIKPEGHFTIRKKTYKFIAILYPQPVNIAIGITKEPIQNIEPFSISLDSPKTPRLDVVGWGCYADRLSFYELKTFDQEAYERKLQSTVDDIRATCVGDSGGPALDHKTIFGVVVGSNSLDTTYIDKLDNLEVVNFFKTVMDRLPLKICGINLECSK